MDNISKQIIEYIPFVSTAVVALATIILAWLTSKYVRLTKQMVDDLKSSREPAINVDFELPDRYLRLVITNSGLSPARNIKLIVIKDVDCIISFGNQKGISGLPPIKNGIAYLISGRTLKYNAGYLHCKDTKDVNFYLSLQVQFENESGKVFKQNVDIDMTQFQDVLFESFKDSNIAVADAVRGIGRRKDSTERMSKLLGSLMEKRCPFCYEMIPKQAKKCSHCREWIKEDDNQKS